MRLRAFAVAMTAALCAWAQTPDPVSMLEHATDPLEGLWRFRDMDGSGATVLIHRDTARPDRLAVTMMYSPDPDIIPGNICGYITPTARSGTYNASFSSSPVPKPGLSLTGKRDFALTVSEDGVFTLKPYNRTHTLSLRRWLPYLFRVSVVEHPDRPDNLDGAIRIYPPTPRRGAITL